MKGKKIKVIIADDHNLFREGLKMLLNADHDIEVVAEASNGSELIELQAAHQPDVIITDLVMPGLSGIDAIKELCVNPSTRIMVITTFDSEFLITGALNAGALGCVIKNAEDDEIVKGVKAVYKYRHFYCKATYARLSSAVSKTKYDPANRSSHQLFSEREKEVIRLVCEDNSTKKIADTLCMGKRTVDGTRSRILAKMNKKSMIGFLTYAVQNYLFFIPMPGNNKNQPSP